MPEPYEEEHRHGGAHAASANRRLRPAPLLFEPAAAAADPEHFFDLESIDDPRELLARSTELALAFRAATDRAVEFQAMAAAQLADPRRFDRLTAGRDRRAGRVDRGLRRRRWSSSAGTCCGDGGQRTVRGDPSSDATGTTRHPEPGWSESDARAMAVGTRASGDPVEWSGPLWHMPAGKILHPRPTCPGFAQPSGRTSPPVDMSA